MSHKTTEAPRHIGEPGCDSAARNLLPQNDCPLVVEAYQMQGVLACIDANGVSDCSVIGIESGMATHYVARVGVSSVIMCSAASDCSTGNWITVAD
jgi:hypothetical protein